MPDIDMEAIRRRAVSVDREAIRTRLNAATPLPWSTDKHTIRGIRRNFPQMKEADLQLLVHAPADTAALLAALEETEAERDNLAITVAWNAMRRAVAEGPEAELVALRARLTAAEELIRRNGETAHEIRMMAERLNVDDDVTMWLQGVILKALAIRNPSRAFLADGPNTEGTDG